jgi:hypothetical protein
MNRQMRLIAQSMTGNDLHDAAIAWSLTTCGKACAGSSCDAGRSRRWIRSLRRSRKWKTWQTDSTRRTVHRRDGESSAS